MHATREICLIIVLHYMVSLVIEEGLSVVNLSAYGVIVFFFFFNLKVIKKRKKEKAVNYKIDNNNFQSRKINLKTMISVQRWR